MAKYKELRPAVDDEWIAAAMIGDTKTLRRKLAEGTCVDGVDWRGNTALMIASGHGRAEALALLLAAGSDPGARPDGGVSPTELATFAGDADCLRQLIDAGAWLAKSGALAFGMAAIDAAKRGEARCLELLIEAGADIEFQCDQRIWTPAVAAAVEGQAKCLSMLLAAGARLDALDEHGRTIDESASTPECARLVAVERARRQSLLEAGEMADELPQAARAYRLTRL